MDTQAAVERLNSQLPLKARQDKLSSRLKAVHMCVLNSLVDHGCPPSQKELQKLLAEDDFKADLQKLGSDDLIVMDSEGNLPIGAYPVTAERTPHKLIINEHVIYAMCALDAVSVAPVFGREVIIESVCHASQQPVRISMQGSEVYDVIPGKGVTIGIRWRLPSSVAAYSMCQEMVFFKDRKTAAAWQNHDLENITLFSLPEAVAFGKAFFLPLLD